MTVRKQIKKVNLNGPKKPMQKSESTNPKQIARMIEDQDPKIRKKAIEQLKGNTQALIFVLRNSDYEDNKRYAALELEDRIDEIENPTTLRLILKQSINPNSIHRIKEKIFAMADQINDVDNLLYIVLACEDYKKAEKAFERLIEKLEDKDETIRKKAKNAIKIIPFRSDDPTIIIKAMEELSNEIHDLTTIAKLSEKEDARNKAVELLIEQINNLIQEYPEVDLDEFNASLSRLFEQLKEIAIISGYEKTQLFVVEKLKELKKEINNKKVKRMIRDILVEIAAKSINQKTRFAAFEAVKYNKDAAKELVEKTKYRDIKQTAREFLNLGDSKFVEELTEILMKTQT